MGVQISVDRLQPGVFIELDLPWHRHPFLLNKFKIKNDEEIAILRDLGLDEITFDPARSDVAPLPKPPTVRPKQSHSPRAAPMAEDKRRRIERLKNRRARFQRCDRTFKKQVSSAKQVVTDIKARPQQALAQATLLVDEMVDVLSSESELMVHLMNDNAGPESAYFHSLNVSVLAMLLAKSLKLDRETMHVIGLGALFHDVGEQRIPNVVLHKPGPWTKAERAFIEQHPRYGADMARKIKGFPKQALTIIEQHHELADGSGFPKQLDSSQISLATKVVQIADVYDNHCNHRDPKLSMTPHQAMSFMMARQSEQLEGRLVQVFIKSMGVYPPGSVVQLSNDMLGIVIAVDRQDLLNPSVLLYDPSVPKAEALVMDLTSEPDLKIVEEVRPGELPPDVFNYLSPRTRVSYYFDSNQAPERRPS